MKKLVLILFIVLFAAGSAYAEGVTTDFGLGVSSEPVGDFGTATGPMVGASVDFNTLVNARFSHSENIRFRGDIGYFKWSDKVYGVSIDYRRIPVFIGGRFVYPVGTVFSVFGEAGGEASFDKVEAAVCDVFGNCKSESEEDIHTGMAFGGGLIFNVSSKFRISLTGRHHAITDSYDTFGALFGINF